MAKLRFLKIIIKKEPQIQMKVLRIFDFFFLFLDLGSTGFNEDINLLIFISHVYLNLVPDVNVSEVLWQCKNLHCLGRLLQLFELIFCQFVFFRMLVLILDNQFLHVSHK